MSLVEQTWDQILYGLDSVLDLCCSLGLKEDVATSRFLKHRDRLGYLIDALRQRGQERARELYDTDRLAHIVAIAESGELINLGPFVQNHKKDRALSKKLQAALSGPEFPDEEDKNSNHARNILFELTFAAKLWTAGLEPTLGDPPDLSCEIDGKALLIECKRPLTENGARSGIKDARSSILRLAKFPLEAGTRGVVALSITKLINPGDMVFSWPNEAEARSGLNDVVREKAERLKNTWGRFGTKVVGIVFHVVTPAFLEDSKLLILQQRTNGYPLTSSETSADGQAFRSMIDSLAKVWY